MAQRTYPSSVRYGFALVSVGLAIALRLLLDPWLGEQVPFATVYLAVLAAGWFGGLGPSVLSVVTGAIASNFFLMAPRGSFDLATSEQRAGLVLFLATSLGISLLAASMHTARQRAIASAESARQKAVLITEGHELLESRVRERTAELASLNEALTASEEKFRVLIEGVSGHAIFMLDRSGKVLTWNKGAEAIDGYTAEEIIGRHYSCLFAPESIADGNPQRELEMASATGKADVEGWRIRKNGSRFWANGTLAAVYDKDRNVQGFAKVTRDLTDKRRNDELLRSVLNHTLDGIVSIDERGTISMMNRAGEALFGRTASEVVGKNVKMLMPAPYHEEHDGYLASYVRTGEAKVIGIGREVSGLRRDGTVFPVDLAVTEFQLDNQRYFVGIVRDISERKKLETQLHQSQKMDAFGQLAGGVAHDFNNLLTVISGNTDVLLEIVATEDGETREILGEIRDAAGRAASLTRQLLAFSRQQVLEAKTVDLNAIVNDTEKMLRRLIGEDVLMTSALSPVLDSVRVDPSQIAQVIINLAVNARDAMPQGGKLDITTSNVDLDEAYVEAHPESRAGRYVRLAVADTGHGIADDLKARIFEPFFTTKGVGRGTGLGLAVVHGIIKQSGGSVGISTAVGVGTTFEVYLPALAEKPVPVVDHGLARSLGGTESILVVEDEESVRKLTVRVLEKMGYTVWSAPSGKAAVALLESIAERIDILVTDVVMPEMSGRELAEALLERHADLTVLYLSGYTGDAVVRHGVLQAEVAFLQKPFTPSALAAKVREALDRRSLERN